MLRVKEQRVKGVVIEGVGEVQIVASISFLAVWYTFPKIDGKDASAIDGNHMIATCGFRLKVRGGTHIDLQAKSKPYEPRSPCEPLKVVFERIVDGCVKGR